VIVHHIGANVDNWDSHQDILHSVKSQHEHILPFEQVPLPPVGLQCSCVAIVPVNARLRKIIFAKFGKEESSEELEMGDLMDEQEEEQEIPQPPPTSSGLLEEETSM
jgi:hypothetical protein